MTEWRFLLDENIDPKAATYLEKEDVYAEHVRDALGQGTDDNEILSYAADNDLVIVTSDLGDFIDPGPDTSVAVVLLYDDALPAYRIATGLLSMITAYPSRDSFGGLEALDAWV